MRITPLDVRKQDFRRSVRGYDCDEVRAFLTTTADEYEAVLVDNKELRERIIEQGEKIAEYSNMEKALRDTLMTAERLMKESKQSARKEGELIVRDAGLKAQKVLDEAQARAADIRREILGLKKEKDAFLARVRSLAQAQIHFIDSHGRDFRDLDRRLFSRTEPQHDELEPPRAAERARRGGDAPRDTAVSGVRGPGYDREDSGLSDSRPQAAAPAEDDVWRSYIPGNLYASTVGANESDSRRTATAAASVDNDAMGTAPVPNADDPLDTDDETAAPTVCADTDVTGVPTSDSVDIDPDETARAERSESYTDHPDFGGVPNDAALAALLDAGSTREEPTQPQVAADVEERRERNAGFASTDRESDAAERPVF